MKSLLQSHKPAMDSFLFIHVLHVQFKGVGGIITASVDFPFVFIQTNFCCQERVVCLSVSQRALQPVLPADTCLYAFITKCLLLLLSGLLPTSRGSLPVSLPGMSERSPGDTWRHDYHAAHPLACEEQQARRELS